MTGREARAGSPLRTREIALEVHPEFVEKLHWGAKVVGVRVSLAKAKPKVVTELLAQA